MLVFPFNTLEREILFAVIVLFDVILFATTNGEFTDVFAATSFVITVPVTDTVAVLTVVFACNTLVNVVPVTDAVAVFVDVLA